MDIRIVPEGSSDGADERTWGLPVPGAPKDRGPSNGIETMPLGPTAVPAPVPGDTDPPGDSAVGKDSATGGAVGASSSGSGGSDSDGPSGSGDWDKQPPPQFTRGSIVFENFELISLLGEGGMGQVWLVRNIKMERKRALKVIKPEIARNDRGWKRFQREAQLMAKLDHPNAVRVFDYKRVQSVGYIEMEYVPGLSVDKVLKDRKGQPMPLDWIVPVLDQLCAVLHEAHEHVDEDTGRLKPIIHRDLKPSNLMIVERKVPGKDLKVLDFGIAKMINDEDAAEETLTGYGEFLGTVAYCSPEQIRDAGRLGREDDNPHQEVSARSDLYSVGVMLYQFLTGVLPFRGPIYAVLASHLRDMPPPMAKANPEAKVPPEVERVVFQCLAKDPASRPRNALELAEKFRSAAGLQRRVPRPRPSLLVAAVALVAVLIVAVPLALWATRGSGKPSRRGNQPDTRNGGTKTPRDGTGISDGPDAPSTKGWELNGYAAVDRKSTVGPSNEPLRIRRESDGVEFYRYKLGVYLPVGFEPEDDQKVGDWPQALIRTEDKRKDPSTRMRFVRVGGQTFLQGDPRSGDPAVDVYHNPCTKHWVRVAPFYVQDSEATNADVETYLQSYSEDKRSLEMWRKAYDLHKEKSLKNAARYPAIGVNYLMARKIARFYGGRLASESEWELVAKSGADDAYWSWGDKPPPGGKKWARVFSDLLNDAKTQPTPDPVKKNEKDETKLHVFDMTGNVREWCLDLYRPYGESVPKDNASDRPMDDRVPEEAIPAPSVDPNQDFVVRGGSFQTDLEESKVFLRGKLGAAEELDDVGFRIVIECPP